MQPSLSGITSKDKSPILLQDDENDKTIVDN